MRIRIHNGRILSPVQGLDQVADLYLTDGQITAIGKAPKGFKADQEIDAKDQVVCPGLVDLSARFREPGLEHKGTIASESRAAAKGGVTSVCCPPDTQPVIDTPAVVELIHQRSNQMKHTRIYPLGALTHGLGGERLAEMQTLKSVGCVGVSNGLAAIEDTEVLRRAMEYAATCDLTVFLFCEDPYLRNRGVAHEGIMGMRLGLPAIPETAETVAVSRALLLAEHSGTRLHICRLSSANSVNLIAEARSKGLNVTADVSIHHLHLTEMDTEGFNSQCHLHPPLRTESDKQGLIQGLANGVINCICSDHQPHDDDAKTAPFSLTEAGASGIEMLLPLVLQLVESNQLDLATAIAALTHKPAEILGLDAGRIEPGMPADLCIFDPNQRWTVDREQLISMGKNTPYEGWQLPGQVTCTLLDGKIVYQS